MKRHLQTHITHEGYSVGHYWYYRLGGSILKPKAIRGYVIAARFTGYMAEDIDAVDRMDEPARSTKLRAMKAKVAGDITSDLSRYREVASEIRNLRRAGLTVDRSATNCPYLSISLKFAHLSNGFAHLNRINELLTRQGDLFG
ncbi:hypothetical protein [Thalassobius sp. I31.1]|uniref:hypothetical protein n=1 Tax=Thalassobius sp. I31.1 TaxID=2109912 RepID=UPI000D1A9149|nr:hypothetical protein [Thalassobius sp. I31.1]